MPITQPTRVPCAGWTVSGDQCRNLVTPPETHCHVHRWQKTAKGKERAPSPKRPMTTMPYVMKYPPPPNPRAPERSPSRRSPSRR